MNTRPTGKPADWYPDPERKRKMRYWDGKNWTDNWVPVAKGRRIRRPPPEDIKVNPATLLPVEPPEFTFDQAEEFEEHQRIAYELEKPVPRPGQLFIPKKTLKQRVKDSSRLLLAGAMAIVSIVVVAKFIVLPRMGEEKPKADPALTVTVPNLAGEPIAYARDLLKEGRLTVGEAVTLQGKHVGKSNNWLVCSTDPRAGVKIPRESGVRLVVARALSDCP